jgi:hypothetical protein
LEQHHLPSELACVAYSSTTIDHPQAARQAA